MDSHQLKALVSLSGGLDSTTLLAEAIAQGRECECIGFTYGSKHNEYENTAARAIATFYEVPFEIIDLSGAMAGFKSNLLKSGGEIPEGHYAEESMKQTVVPCRNVIFLAILAGLAESRECDEVWIGVHAGDHAIYPDCRPDFLREMSAAIRFATEHKVALVAPFIGMDKGAIVQHGLGLEVPYQLTRTCYKDQPVACGKCGSCCERIEAFTLNSMTDPIKYEDQLH